MKTIKLYGGQRHILWRNLQQNQVDSSEISPSEWDSICFSENRNKGDGGDGKNEDDGGSEDESEDESDGGSEDRIDEDGGLGWGVGLGSTVLDTQSIRGLNRSSQGMPRIMACTPIEETKKVSRL